MADVASRKRRTLYLGAGAVALVAGTLGVLTGVERAPADERVYAVVLGAQGRCIARIIPDGDGVTLSFGEALSPERRASAQGLVLQRAVELVGQTVRIPGGSARIQRVFANGLGQVRAEFVTGTGAQARVGVLEGGCFPEP
ncbi:MAG: hypothetical protein RL653_3630 [Pseudomonadota bacterium]|jgi:hypothetical protein